LRKSFESHKYFILIYFAILFSALIGVSVRLIPFDIIISNHPRLEGLCDTWFLLTQTELVAHNYPMYSWFYPAIGFPQGLETIEMNPLLPLIAATILLLTSGSGEVTNISIISFIPLFSSLLLIPITYYFGKMMYGKFAGIAAAALVCVIPSILIRTTLGYLDHHCFEILFSAGFCYYFVKLIPEIFAEKTVEKISNDEIFIRLPLSAIILSALFFTLGILNVITMMVFFAIVMIVLTIASLFVDSLIINKKRLILIYYLIFLPSTFILILLSIISQSFVIFRTFNLLALALLGGGIWLWIIFSIPEVFRRLSLKRFFILFLIFLSGLLIAITNLFLPQSWELINYFFAYPYTLNLEWTPLTIDGFLKMYGIALFPISIGLIYSIHQIWKLKNIQWIFILFWFSFFLFAAFQHQRHLYYLDYPFVILAGAGLNEIWIHGGKFIRTFKLYTSQNTDSLIQDNADLPYGKSIPPSFFQKNSIPLSDWLGRILAIFIFFCIILQFSSVSYEWVKDDFKNDVLNQDFIDAMIWLQNNSPDTGINPSQIYLANHYEVPSDGYSLITPWIYGYAAHYWAKRPVSTSGNKETNGALIESLYGSRNQSFTDEVMKSLGGRYLIVTADFLNDELPMYLYRGSQIPPIISIDEYLSFLTDTDITGEEKFYPEFYQPFYETLAIHLYLFNGSHVQGKFTVRNAEQGSESILSPPYDLDELHHFRLVYESNTTVTPYTGPVQDSLKLFDVESSPSKETALDKIPRVKIFEYKNITEIQEKG